MSCFLPSCAYTTNMRLHKFSLTETGQALVRIGAKSLFSMLSNERSAMQKYFWRETPAHHYPASYRRLLSTRQLHLPRAKLLGGDPVMPSSFPSVGHAGLRARLADRFSRKPEAPP